MYFLLEETKYRLTFVNTSKQSNHPIEDVCLIDPDNNLVKEEEIKEKLNSKFSR